MTTLIGEKTWRGIKARHLKTHSGDSCETCLVLIEFRDLERQIRKLLDADGHAHGCAFAGCTCGKVDAYKAARTDLWRYLRALA